MNKEIKNLIEEETEKRIKRIFEFNWRRIFGE